MSELEKDKACLQQECAELKEKAVIIEVVQSKTLNADSKTGYSRSYSDNSYSTAQTSRKPSLEAVHAQSVDSGVNWDQSKKEVWTFLHNTHMYIAPDFHGLKFWFSEF